MKILKHGSKYLASHREFKFICNVCGCEYIKSSKELMFDQQIIAYTVQSFCPECDSFNSSGEEIEPTDV